MSNLNERYDRNIRLFAAEGQQKLRAVRVAVAGVSGLGSPVAQHLALLGVGHISLIEPEELDDTNRNRFVAARATDPVPGSPKVMLARRMINEINPDVDVVALQNGLVSDAAFTSIKSADWVFGCFDHDGPRYILNELCAAYEKPYIDLASDVPEPGVYGGHVCISDGAGCLSCFDMLNMSDVEAYLISPEAAAARDAIYGVNKEVLAEKKGPSVSPLNGIVASMGVMEFMVAVTGMRPPKSVFNYYGHLGKVTHTDRSERRKNCQFCDVIRGQREQADVERYLRMPHLI
jgi:molybdopterin/thiamine biosynthesis adenylyltransferase